MTSKSKSSSMRCIATPLLAFLTVIMLSSCNHKKTLETKLKENVILTLSKNGVYDVHITKCKIDTTLFIVGLEWGAARQHLSIVKCDDDGTILWETEFDPELPGYVRSVEQISLEGISYPIIKISAGERGVYEDYLFELKDSTLNRLKR